MKSENLNNYSTSKKVEFDRLQQNSDQESVNYKLAKSYMIMKHESKRKKKTSKKRENWLKTVKSQKILRKVQQTEQESGYKDVGFSNYDTYRDYIW